MNLSERDDVICDMAALGLPLRQIGYQFGISGERVRQILGRRGVSTAAIREQIKKERENLPRWPIIGLKRRMYEWLRRYGFQRCAFCLWQPSSEFSSPRTTVCRECGRKRANVRYHTSDYHREYAERYRMTEMGKAVQREAGKRYWAKKMSTEEGREAARKRGREAQRKYSEKRKLQGLKGEGDGNNR